MPAKTPQDFYLLSTPITGKMQRTDGESINQADAILASTLLDPRAVSLRKQAYFVQDRREDVPDNDEYIYRIESPADKSVAIFNRDIKASDGPINFEVIAGAAQSSSGTLLNPTNLYTGGPACGCEVEAGVGVTGGTVIPADYLYGSGFFFSSQPTAASTDLPTIVPPNTSIFVRITNESGGTAGIRFALAFAELELPDVAAI